MSRDGSSAVNIVKAAKAYGFAVSKYRRSPESIRKKGFFPCIIHWNFDHFVVLNGFKGRYAYINDPANGAIRVDEEEFDRSFTEITINAGIVYGQQTADTLLDESIIAERAIDEILKYYHLKPVRIPDSISDSAAF